MTRTICTIILIQSAILLGWGQTETGRCSRSAEEEAEKQTEMMQRELQLTEVQRDSIFKINLKYAKERRKSNTRGEMLERMNAMDAELKQILTAEQYHQFMNCQLNDGPKRPASFMKRPRPEAPQRDLPTTSSDSVRQSNR